MNAFRRALDHIWGVPAHRAQPQPDEPALLPVSVEWGRFPLMGSVIRGKHGIEVFVAINGAQQNRTTTLFRLTAETARSLGHALIAQAEAQTEEIEAAAASEAARLEGAS